jgi:hypothetical protein
MRPHATGDCTIRQTQSIVANKPNPASQCEIVPKWINGGGQKYAPNGKNNGVPDYLPGSQFTLVLGLPSTVSGDGAGCVFERKYLVPMAQELRQRLNRAPR